MATVEIDEGQLRLLQTAYQTLDALTSNPKTKRDAEKLVKTLHPNIVTSDDLADPIVGPLREKIEKLESRLAKEDEDKVVGRYQKQIDDLKSQGYTDDGIEKIKKMMVDRSNPDMDAAVALFEKQNPKPAEKPAGLRSNHWSIGAKDDKAEVDDLMKDESAWASNKAYEVLDEIKKNGQPAFGGVVGVGR